MTNIDVRSYMRADPLTTRADATLADLVQSMLQKKEHWAVVTDESKKVTGVISSWDIIERLVPDYLEDDKHLASFTSPDTFAERIGEIKNDTVDSLMTKDVKMVRPEDSLMKAATLMSEFRLHCLPVVDEKGALVGAIKQSEMRQAIADNLR
jgi:CBS-domain-containing membrane protein